ncbi:large ribosomal subunit protein mL48 isoform X1 [Pongo pygmaeus]
MMRKLSESRCDIVAAPGQGRSVSVFRHPGNAAAGAGLRFARLEAAKQQRMSGTLEKVLCLRNNTIFKQAFSLLRFRTSGEKPLCSVERGSCFSRLEYSGMIIAPCSLELLGSSNPPASASGVAGITGGILLSTSRPYKTKPTHGIGKYKHLIKAEEPKKKRGKVEVRDINLGTDYEYGVLNIHLTAYDMTLAESYAQYVHNLCNSLSIKVEESYAMPTKTIEVLQLQDQGSKMFLDSVLTTHERVVQISGLSATFAEIFLEIIQSSLPEGVRLSVKEHTEEDFKGRFKARPELEELLAKLK